MNGHYQSEIVLGERYRDSITGFEGVATSIAFHQYGCARVSLRAMVEHKPADNWFDEPALKPVDSTNGVGFSRGTTAARG